MRTYHLIRRGILKKFLIGFIVLILIITVSFVLFRKSSDELAAANTDEEIENTLAKSMEETKKDKETLEQFMTKTSKKLYDIGYPVSLSFSHEERSLTVQVQDKAFLEANRKNIHNIIHNTAIETEFQDFEVDFIILDNFVSFSEEDENLRESTMKVYGEISSLLKGKGYNNYSISTNPNNNEMIIKLEETKVTLESKELEKLIAHILSKSDLDFTIKLQKKTESAIRDQQWQPIFEAVREETSKKYEDYRGFAYSFHPEPLQIIIKTDLDTPKWFSRSNKKVKQITKYVDKIIELKRNELSLEEIPYKIIIRDKNDKKIN